MIVQFFFKKRKIKISSHAKRAYKIYRYTSDFEKIVICTPAALIQGHTPNALQNLQNSRLKKILLVTGLGYGATVAPYHSYI